MSGSSNREYPNLFKRTDSNFWYGWYYVDGRRIKVCTKLTDKRAASQFMWAKERAATDPDRATTNAPPCSLTTALELFLSKAALPTWKPRPLRPATVVFYRKRAGQIIRLLGDLDIHDPAFKNRVEKYISTRDKEGASRNTINKELITVRCALWCVKDEGIYQGEPKTALPEFSFVYQPRKRHLSPDQCERLLEAFPVIRQRWILIAALSGGRKSEVDLLEWPMVNFEGEALRLNGTKTPGSDRVVPLDPLLKKVLQAVPEAERVGPVAGMWHKAPRDLKNACERLKLIPTYGTTFHLSPNDLRRTFASWMKQNGAESKAVAQLLGHTNTRMVDLVYGQLNAASLKSAMALRPKLKVKGLTDNTKTKRKKKGVDDGNNVG